MQQAKHVADGFRFTSSITCLFVTFLWAYGYLPFWLSFPLFILLAASFLFNCFRLVKQRFGSNPPEKQVKQTKAILISTVGVGISCWFFDVLSTFFAVDINQSAVELNPLGWPYSAFVALVYYIPIMFVMYYLLYKLKKKGPFYAASVISVGTLIFGATSLNAALNNFVYDYSVECNPWIACIWSIIVVCLTGWNIVAVRSSGISDT